MIGQTLPPIEGNPEAVRTLSRTLRSAAGRLTSINAVLVDIKAGASWDSPAGELFEAAVQQSPPVLDALIDRYAGAAVALMTFSDELEHAQSRATAARVRYESSTREYLHLEDLLVSVMGTPEQAGVEERQRFEMRALLSAEDDHSAAWGSFTRADRQLARQLRHLADDILDDSAFYSSLAMMDEFSQEVACIPPVSRRIPVLGALSTAGEVAAGVSGVALLALYGEGSWKKLGANTVLSASGLGARGLKAGSLAGSRATSRLADRQRGYVGEKLSAKERFFIGTREELHRQFPKLSKAIDPHAPNSRMVVPLGKVPTMDSTKGMSLKQKAQVWRAQGAAIARHSADKVFLDNWRAASAGGSGAQRMFVAGSTLETAVPLLEEGANDVLVDQPSRSVNRP